MKRRAGNALFAYDASAEGASSTLTIQITGDVRKPGTYPIRGGASLLLYLQDAGLKRGDSTAHSIVILRNFGKDRRPLQFRLDEPELLPRPKAGDVIIVSDPGDAATQKPIPITRARGRRAADLIDVPRKQNTLESKRPTPEANALLAYTKQPAIKRLLNLLAERQAATGAKSFAVMSPAPADGRTFFCATVGLSYALLLDSKVLILNCSSTSHRIFEELSLLTHDERERRSLLRACIDVQTAEQLKHCEHDSIDFTLRGIIEQYSEQYDLILLDTFPTTAASAEIDPVIAAAQTDGAIVVLRAASQEERALKQLASVLQQHNVPVLGVVTNILSSST